MDCFTFLFLGIIVGVGISQVIEKNKANRFQQNIIEAYRNGNDAEILRLTKEQDRRAGGGNQAVRNAQGDLDYLEAMFVLDAAEHGIFTADGYQIFEHREDLNQGNPAEYEPEEYDQYVEESDGGEYSDHWGLG